MQRTFLKTIALGFAVVLGFPTTGKAIWVKEYDSQEDEDPLGATSQLIPWGESNGDGITSWYFISAAPDAEIARLSLHVHSTDGDPHSYTWQYRIKIGATTDWQITEDPDSQVASYTTVHSNWDPGNTFTATGWYDVDLETAYEMDSSKNYIVKFEYVSGGGGGASDDNGWYSTGDWLTHYSFAQEFGGATSRTAYLPRIRMWGNRAELHVYSFDVTPGVLWSHRAAHVTLDIRNISDVNVTESYHVVLQYRPVGQAGWTQIGGAKTVSGHDAWAHETQSWHWDPPGAGSYELEAIVDSDDDVFEVYEDNNRLSDIPANWVYRVYAPPYPLIRTLVLTDSWRWTDIGYSQQGVDALMDDLEYLVENDPWGKGVLFDVADFDAGSAAVTARDDDWLPQMGTSTTKSGTNAYVDALDEFVEDQHHYHYPDVARLIIVGSHEVIPMHVRLDEVGVNGTREVSWGGAYDWQTDMYYLYTVPAPGNYLTDAKYADLAYADEAEETHLTRELAVGRLVETPEQIRTVIANYFSTNGVNPMDDLACIGSFDFTDGAWKTNGDWTALSYAPDSTLVANSFASTSVPGKLESQNDLVYMGGHGDYNLIATAAHRDSNDDVVVDDAFMAGDHATRGDTEDIGSNSLWSAVVIAAGCHNGALLPNKTYHEPDAGTTYRDFPEEFSSNGAIAYLGATGFTWISTPDGDSSDTATLLSEVLCSETAKMYAQGAMIGEAYRGAANQYYANHKETLTTRDKKVLGIHQVYGMPGYRAPSVASMLNAWHFGNTSYEQTGDKIEVQTTLYIDAWMQTPEGMIVIPGAEYTGDESTPVLPVIRFTEEVPVPPRTCVKSAFYNPGSYYVDVTGAVPTASLGQMETYVPAMPFTGPDFYPRTLCTGFVTPNEGGVDASVGMVICPVQYHPGMFVTRVWEELELAFEYDMAQFPFCDAFSGGDLSKWTVTEAGAATTSLDLVYPASPPYCIEVYGADAAGDRVKVESQPIDLDFTKPYRIELKFRWSDFHWDRFLVFGHVRLLLDQPSLPIKYDPVGNNSFGYAVGAPFDAYAPPDMWLPICVDVDPSVRQYTIRVENEFVGTVTYQETVDPSSTLWFEDNGSVNNYLDAAYDDFLVMGTLCGPLAGDFNHDGDVDLDDFEIFADCTTGPGGQAAQQCQACDLNGDEDVDLEDFGDFQVAFTGS